MFKVYHMIMNCLNMSLRKLYRENYLYKLSFSIISYTAGCRKYLTSFP